MKDLEKIIVAPKASIRDTIIAIDDSGMQIALVVDDDKKLLGTVTDGDIRRGILKGTTLDEMVQVIMNPDPVVVSTNENRDAIMTIMRSKSIHQIPIVDDDGRLVGIEILDEMLQPPVRTNPVVLMAGGLGQRLMPLTNSCPKPLLRVGNKPILETIIENFLEHGFRRFYLSVNYKAEMIEQYFGDGNRWGVEISYLRETSRMGTAGALSLLPPGIDEPLLVMNGDLLTKVNFSNILTFHCDHKVQATMCVRDYEFQVPYGVVRFEKHKLLGIEEKPMQRFFVSAGIYVLEPEILHMIPARTYFDMPRLFEELIRQKCETAVFPVREYWLDIGRIDDFERAKVEFCEVFE